MLKYIIVTLPLLLCNCAMMGYPNYEDCQFSSSCLSNFHHTGNTHISTNTTNSAKPVYQKPHVNTTSQYSASFAMAEYLEKTNVHGDKWNGGHSCAVDRSDAESITLSCWRGHLPNQIDLRKYGWNGYAKTVNIFVEYTFHIQTFQYISYDPTVSNTDYQPVLDTMMYNTLIEQTIDPSYNTTTYSSSTSTYSSGDVYVSGHYRRSKSGKVSYVRPHYRSRPGRGRK